MARGNNHVDSYTINGNIIIRRGDCVLMKPVESDQPPYVARVEKLVLDQNNKMMVRVRWYYRPEDTEGGRRSYHGIKEVFLSNVFDLLSVETIEGTCVIHTLRNYIKLESEDDHDYFCRYQYDASERPATAGERYSPKTVAVYCICEMPYNPDRDMVQCDRCLNWYHLECIHKRIEDVQERENFSCFKCHDDAE